MWECLESTQALFDAFRLVPVESYPFLTFVSILHLALAIIKALRLLCVEDDAWDLDAARTMSDIPGNLHQLSKRFETASSLGTARCEIILHGRPIFSDYAQAYRDIERGYVSSLGPGTAHINSTSVDAVLAQDGEPYGDFEFWNELSDLTDGLVP